MSLISDYFKLCTVCGDEAAGDEARTLTVFNGKLEISPRGITNFTALDDERARACGQQHVLVLTERFLERCTFAPADHAAPAAATEDGFPDLH